MEKNAASRLGVVMSNINITEASLKLSLESSIHHQIVGSVNSTFRFPNYSQDVVFERAFASLGWQWCVADIRVYIVLLQPFIIYVYDKNPPVNCNGKWGHCRPLPEVDINSAKSPGL